MHWEVLDTARLATVPFLVFARESGFYLAGGTALALQIGHRESIDFDFFCEKEIDTHRLWDSAEASFGVGQARVVLQDEGALIFVTHSGVNVSFYRYRHPHVVPLLVSDSFDMAHMRDIAVMKLDAMTRRTVQKDYVDMYFILQEMPLSDVIDDAQKKLPSIDPQVLLRSLAYFSKAEPETIIYRPNMHVEWRDIEEFLTRIIREYYRYM